jgi:hypothetical protein
MALNVRTIKKLTEPGRYSDGQGLYLHIRRGGSRQWVLRTTINQKRCDVGIGALESISLAEARDLAYELRKEAKAGGDPLADLTNDLIGREACVIGLPLNRDQAPDIVTG